MPIYLEYAMHGTQLVLAAAVLVGVGLTLWDLSAPVGRSDDYDPDWYLDYGGDDEE